MKKSMQIFLAVVFTIIPLYESNAASIDDFLGRTYIAIAPEFTYRLQYEDNIDGDRDGKDRISDWSNQYSPQISISSLSPKVSFNTDVRLNIVEYIKERDFNYVDQDYSFGVGYLMNERIEFSLGAGYKVYTNTFRTDEGGAGDFGEDYTRYKDKTWDYHGGVSYQLSSRSNIALSGFLSDYDTRNSDDTQFWGLIATYTKSISPRTNALLNAGYFNYEFKGSQRKLDPDDPFSLYAFLDQTMKNYSLTAGIEHSFANDSSFLISGGVRYSEQDTSTTNAAPDKETDSGNGQGWVADIQWRRAWTEWIQAFEAHHDIKVNPSGSTYEETSIISRTTYNINRRLHVSLYLRARKAEGDGDEFSVDRDTRYYSIQPSVGYKLYRWLDVTAKYAFRYADYKNRGHTTHWNIFYIELNFTPLRSLVLR